MAVDGMWNGGTQTPANRHSPHHNHLRGARSCARQGLSNKVKHLHLVNSRHVTGDFQAFVLCFRLHFGKDSVTINTAAATVRQLFTSVFERVVFEDGNSAAGASCSSVVNVNNL